LSLFTYALSGIAANVVAASRRRGHR